MDLFYPLNGWYIGGSIIIGGLLLRRLLASTPPYKKLKGHNDIYGIISLGWYYYRKHKVKLNKQIQNLYKAGRPLENKLVIVTGCTSGLGKGIAGHLLALGAILILPIRREIPTLKQDLFEYSKSISPLSVENSMYTMEEAEDRMHIVKMDLSDFVSIRNAVKTIRNKYGEASVFSLVNNAGLVNPSGRKNNDGIEMTLAVNALGTILFTELLLNSSVLSYTSGSAVHSKIISISSGEHRESPMLDRTLSLEKQPIFEDMRMSQVLVRYACSKFIQTCYFLSLQETFFKEEKKVRVLDICPGAVKTKIATKGEGTLQKVFGYFADKFMSLGLFGILFPDEASKPMVDFIASSSPYVRGGSCHYLRSEAYPAREDTSFPENIQYVRKEVQKLVNKYKVD